MISDNPVFEPDEIELLTASSAELILKIKSNNTEFLRALEAKFNDKYNCANFTAHLDDDYTLIVDIRGWHNLERVRDLKGEVCCELYKIKFGEKH